MEILLVQKDYKDIEIGTNSPQSFKCRVQIPEIKISSSLLNGKLLLDNFKKHFAEKFGLDKEWTVLLELTSYDLTSNTSSSKAISLQGKLLKELHYFFHGDNKNKLLEIEVTAKHHLGPSLPRRNAWIKARGFTPRVDAAGHFDHAVYLQRAVELAPLPTHTVLIGNRMSWVITIKIKVSPTAFICLEGILPKAEDTAREIFETKKFPDFTIISEDGTRLPCHKLYLAKSPVLTQMLEGGFQEARTNEMIMGDMTTQGVNALLEFLYCGTVNQAMTHCDIAVELLKAADMYDLPILWNAMTSILSAKTHSWYTVDVALRLFAFVKNCAREESKSLIKKSIQVVGLKPEQLSRSTAFKELFPSQASQDMFLTALKSSHP